METDYSKASAYLDVELKDGHYPDYEGNGDWGGISFVGETLKDFIDECDDLSYDTSMHAINNALLTCNIQPIELPVRG